MYVILPRAGSSSNVWQSLHLLGDDQKRFLLHEQADRWCLCKWVRLRLHKYARMFVIQHQAASALNMQPPLRILAGDHRCLLLQAGRQAGRDTTSLSNRQARVQIRSPANLHPQSRDVAWVCQTTSTPQMTAHLTISVLKTCHALTLC